MKDDVMRNADFSKSPDGLRTRTCGFCGGSGNTLSTRYGISWRHCSGCNGSGAERYAQKSPPKSP